MKASRWLPVALTLGIATLLPGLPELDAQGRCPRGVQLQQLSRQTQTTRMFEQQMTRQRQMQQQRQVEQARQMMQLQQKRQLETKTRMQQQTRLAQQSRTVADRVPVSRLQATPIRQITDTRRTGLVGRLYVHGGGPGVVGNLPTATTATARRQVDGLLLARRTDLATVGRTATSTTRTTTQQGRPVTTANYSQRMALLTQRQVTNQARTAVFTSRDATVRVRRIDEHHTATRLTWNMTCIACHQRQGLPHPVLPGPKGPNLPNIVRPPLRQPDVIVRLPQVPVRAVPANPVILPPLRPGPRPEALVGPRPTPNVRPGPVIPWWTPGVRPDAQGWVKRTDPPRKGDSSTPRSPGEETPRRPLGDLIAAPKAPEGGKPTDVALTATAPAPARLLPAELLEMPTSPHGLTGVAPQLALAVPLSAGGGAARDDAHAAPVVRPEAWIVSDDDLQTPDMPVLPRSVLVLSEPQERPAAEDLEVEPDLPPPGSPDRHDDRLVRAAPAAPGGARPTGSGSVDLEAPSRATLPRSVLGPG